MTTVTVLGSTGSIGVSTLDVVGRRPEQFQIFALVAGNNMKLLGEQIARFRPRMASVASEERRQALIGRLNELGLAPALHPQILTGPAGRVACAVQNEVDFVMSSIVGVAGLEATYEAICLGKRVGLATKEVLVASGQLVMDAVRRNSSQLIPVDSEHNGAHQCFRAGRREEVSRLILTASGGPFRETPVGEFESITPAQALNHPTWRMGPRITIDSATMMNKGFEVVEACWLFGLPPKQVDVVVHPQSSVHAMVEYNDGSIIAQVSATDMRMPIQYALTYPARESAPVPRLDWTQTRTWNFSAPDMRKFPLLGLAYAAQETGGSATCTLNAADEIAVSAFLEEKISFPGIARVVAATLDKVPVSTPASVAEVLDVDRRSRETARQIVASLAGKAAPQYSRAG